MSCTFSKIDRRLGCPRERFLALTSGTSPDFLQAYKNAYYTQHIKKLYRYPKILIRFCFNLRYFNPRIIFGQFLGHNFSLQPAAPIRLVSKCSKFTSESFENTLETSGDFPPTVLPTQRLKSRFSIQKFQSSCPLSVSF